MAREQILEVLQYLFMTFLKMFHLLRIDIDSIYNISKDVNISRFSIVM